MSVQLAPYEIAPGNPAHMPYDTLPTPDEIIAWLEGKDPDSPLGNPSLGEECPLHQFFDEVRDVETAVGPWSIGFHDPNTGLIHHDVVTDWFCDNIQSQWMDRYNNDGVLTVAAAIDEVRELVDGKERAVWRPQVSFSQR